MLDMGWCGYGGICRLVQHACRERPVVVCPERVYRC